MLWKTVDIMIKVINKIVFNSPGFPTYVMINFNVIGIDPIHYHHAAILISMTKVEVSAFSILLIHISSALYAIFNPFQLRTYQTSLFCSFRPLKNLYNLCVGAKDMKSPSIPHPLNIVLFVMLQMLRKWSVNSVVMLQKIEHSCYFDEWFFWKMVYIADQRAIW